MNKLDFIRERVPKAELLAQLAEEAAELAHAALKLRRVWEGVNPTPVTRREAFENLQEEIADVMLLVELIDYQFLKADRGRIMMQKLERWVARLLAAEEAVPNGEG